MTETFERTKFRVPLRLRLRYAARGVYLLLVVGLIPVVLWLVTKDSPARRFTGVVEPDAETVGAVAAARIASVEVQEGQRVRPGDVLVRLDPSDRTLDLAVQEAKLANYSQALLRYDQTQENYRQTLQESERRCRQTVQEASVALESERMNCRRDLAELEGLRAEIARLQPLVDRHLVSEIELSSLRPKVQALEQTTQEYGPLVTALQKRYDQAVADFADVQKLLLALSQKKEDVSVKETVQQASQTYRSAKGDPYVLRATRAGIVSRIQRQAGDVVVAGEPIIRVTAETSATITGLLTQRQFAGLTVGSKLRATPVSDSARRPVVAEVESIDPEVLDLIDPFNLAPRVPVRGRRVHLRVLDENNALVPGETVLLGPAQSSLLENVRRYCFSRDVKPSSL
jgi:multidrug resistance efflux pump